MKHRNYMFKIRPRFSDTDAYQCIHHAAYFQFFEETRFKFAYDILNLAALEHEYSDIQFPVIRADCKYKEAIVYTCQELSVGLDFEILGESKLVFTYALYCTDKLVATGKTEHAFVQSGVTKYPIPQFFLEHIKKSLKELKMKEGVL